MTSQAIVNIDASREALGADNSLYDPMEFIRKFKGSRTISRDDPCVDFTGPDLAASMTDEEWKRIVEENCGICEGAFTLDEYIAEKRREAALDY